MNIIVLVKQVPNTTEVKLDLKTGNLIREGIESIVNPDDLHAVEAAVRRHGDGMRAAEKQVPLGPAVVFGDRCPEVSQGVLRDARLEAEFLAL
mgnify:CR=1 FL=1